MEYIKKTSEILKNEYNGDIPETVELLCKLPGVGPKMAYLVMKCAWNQIKGNLDVLPTIWSSDCQIVYVEYCISRKCTYISLVRKFPSFLSMFLPKRFAGLY